MKNRKKIKEKKRQKLATKKLVKKYPWLQPSAHWYNGRIIKKRDWNYSWTWYDDMPKGWKKCFGKMFLEELDIAIRKAGLYNVFGIDQLKEKYGRLECYVHGFNDEINQIIDKYSYISQNVCISCGTIDVPMVNDSWISPFCFSCFKKYQLRYDESKTDEELHDLYDKLTSKEQEDWKICDYYIISRYSKDKRETITYDISDTVKKIRSRYAQIHR